MTNIVPSSANSYDRMAENSDDDKVISVSTNQPKNDCNFNCVPYKYPISENNLNQFEKTKSKFCYTLEIKFIWYAKDSIFYSKY